MWKWPTRICVCRQIVKALQNYFCQIESYFFHMVLSQAQRFWNHTDVWFFWFLLNKTKHICLESWISCLHYEDNSDENFNTRHSVPLSFIATKYSSISHGQLPVGSVNNFYISRKSFDENFTTRLHCFHCQQIFKCSDISWAAGRPRGIGE